MNEELYSVTIDLDALEARLKWSCRPLARRGHTLRFLIGIGFAETRWPGVFVGRQTTIDQLQPAEVVSAKPMGS